MNPELAARRLSGALGRKVKPEDVEEITYGHVFLKSGESFRLLGGNAAYCGNGVYYRNGKPWENVHEEGQDPRWE